VGSRHWPGPRDVVPHLYLVATAGSIARLGAQPVFVDIDPETYNLCLDSAHRVAEGPRNGAMMS